MHLCTERYRLVPVREEVSLPLAADVSYPSWPIVALASSRLELEAMIAYDDWSFRRWASNGHPI